MPFKPDAEIVLAALDQYDRETVTGEARVFNQPPLKEIADDLDLESLARQGGLTGARLETFLQKYLACTTRLNHPKYMGHQVAATHYSGALGSLIDGFTDNGMAIYEMGPAATAIEYFALNFLLEKIGWVPAPLPPDSRYDGKTYGGGVLVNGGSLANLTALIAARTALAPDVWTNGNPGDLAMLVSPQSHYSVARAAGILGIGQKAMYTLEVDARGVILPDRLPAAYARLQSDGQRAMALVTSDCSTAVGLYDPLQEIGAFCRENGIWLHVDGAHGASALLSPRLKHLLKGVEQADSLVWDMHKMLRTPTLCAAVLVRDGRRLEAAFQQEASYLFHEKQQPGIDFIERTVECTKAALGLRFFMVLAALGEAGLAEYVERQYDLGAEAYRFIRALPGFTCAVEPQANILCFRVDGSDELQMSIREHLLERGDFYISTTAFMGRRWLRLALMSPQTTLADIRELIAEVQRLAETIKNFQA